jgi:class 3 adenylate cyclase
MVDSFGKKVHYAEKALFAFDENHRIVYGLQKGDEINNPRVKQVIVYNSPKTKYRIFYDRLTRREKFYVSVADDLKKEIFNSHGIDILKMEYRMLKRFLKKHYYAELRSAKKERLSGRRISAVSAAITLPTVLSGTLSAPAVASAAAVGASICVAGIARDIYMSYVRRIARLRAEDARDRLERETDLSKKLRSERDNSRHLLLSILPEPIADRLATANHSTIADYFESISVLFSDLEGFTAASSKINATVLVTILNDLFSRFDILAQEYGVEKIKTIGDAYMAVCGLPEKRDNNAEVLVRFGMAMHRALDDFNKKSPISFAMRIGVNSGPVTAGVIGKTKFSYDLWGDTVNIASRMESTGKIECVHVSSSVYEQTKHLFPYIPHLADVKGVGEMNTYLLKVRS